MFLFFFVGGESIYGAPFADEFHSRLRFNHRGIVACANAGSPHSNGSQFFISLDKCEWLDRKNTIFGKVPSRVLAFKKLKFMQFELPWKLLELFSGDWRFYF